MIPVNANYLVVRLALRYIVVSMVTTICSTIATGIPPNRFFAVLALAGLSYLAYAAIHLAPRHRNRVQELYLLLVVFVVGLVPFLGWVLALDLLWGGSFLIGAGVGLLLMTTKPAPQIPQEY